MPESRNVLMIMADELSWFALGCYDPAIVKTPVIDVLAAGGIRFDAAYTPSPICVPARAAFATAQYVNAVGYWTSADPYHGAVPGWGHRLIEAGHEVVSIGKLHYRSTGDPNGFSEEIEPIHVIGGTGWKRSLLRREGLGFDAASGLAEEIGPGETSYTHYDRRVTEATCDWLSAPARQGGKAWTAFVSFVCPHFPLVAPPEFYSLYDPEALASGAEPVPDHPVVREAAAFYNYDAFFSAEQRGIARAGYYGLCSFLDANVARILDALEQSGQRDDTLIILTSDHGEMLGRKGFWTKSIMYEDAVRVPLIMAGAGVGSDEAGTVRRDPVNVIDLGPTAMHANAPELERGSFQGRSLLEAPNPARCGFSEFHDIGAITAMYAVRWDKWKFVRYGDGHPPQLFDLEADPSEENDLVKAAASGTDMASDVAAALSEGERRLQAICDPDETFCPRSRR